MSETNPVASKLHHIHVKLYPNYLPNVDGKYYARTKSEDSLSIEDVCASLKTRSGYAGNYASLIDNVRQFFDEAVNSLCDGFSINTGYFSIYPNIGGTFNSVSEIHDKKKNPIDFRYRTHAKLYKQIERMVVDIDGFAKLTFRIEDVIDVETGSLNTILTSGGQYNITGYKIKVAGDDPACGVYFFSESKPGMMIKSNSRFAENTSTKVIGVIPELPAGIWKVGIRTQFTGSALLKESRLAMADDYFTVR